MTTDEIFGRFGGYGGYKTLIELVPLASKESGETGRHWRVVAREMTSAGFGRNHVALTPPTSDIAAARDALRRLPRYMTFEARYPRPGMLWDGPDW